MSDEPYVFVACDYSATGEGRTICLLVTRAYPYSEDYVKPSWFDEEGNGTTNLKLRILQKSAPYENLLLSLAVGCGKALKF